MAAETSRLQADYVELANDYLDRVPLKNYDDFLRYEVALQRLLTENKVESCSRLLGERVSSVKELLNSPEIYAAPEHQERFKKIVHDRIAAKIQELKMLSPEAKVRYIAEQAALREKTARAQEKMREATPPVPGTEGHTFVGGAWGGHPQATPPHFGLAIATAAVAAGVFAWWDARGPLQREVGTLFSIGWNEGGEVFLVGAVIGQLFLSAV